MLKKTSRFLANVILILLPFFPILENFFLSVNPDNFSAYLLACAIIWVLMLFLAYLILYFSPVPSGQTNLKISMSLLFTLGMIVMIPLHMGPPRHDETLLEIATQEQFRYLMLFFAAVVFAAGIIAAIKPLWTNMLIFEKAILVPLITVIPIAVWDDYDSGMLSIKLASWIAQGNKAGDFFPNYNFHPDLRATGRILLYVVTSWLTIILCKQKLLNKWVFAILNIYCLAGIVFCVLCVLNGPAYYFPFMVPAVALAPAYWVGLALLQGIYQNFIIKYPGSSGYFSTHIKLKTVAGGLLSDE